MVAKTIVGTIVRQLLIDVPDETFAKLDHQIHDTDLDLEQIHDLLTATVGDKRQYFIIVDGLDECTNAESQRVLRFLGNLLNISNFKVKIYYSCRWDSVNSFPLKTKSATNSVSPAWYIALDPADVAADINCYIQTTLEQKLEDGMLQLGDPHIVLAIQKALKEKVQGMFVDLE